MIISRGSPISGGRGLIAWGRKKGREVKRIEVRRGERKEEGERVESMEVRGSEPVDSPEVAQSV